ncbi:ParD-like family protein [Halomonas sp. MCCC 1A11036]|uniref:ParD-like family protein n=1 Tax=Billgrantia zhangzhouensis TaxID=2733481 RepID=A0ABS9AJ04_9GAMM|nr:ParD-like family protein [Halomonas zhangzhouensis]MCE8021608.1 ParD-like family protein [Halomonas zhangzhouensis]
MGIVKISDELHDEIRKASSPMLRSINAQAEYWIKIGMLAETHPEMTFRDIMKGQLKAASVNVKQVIHG